MAARVDTSKREKDSCTPEKSKREHRQQDVEEDLPCCCLCCTTGKCMRCVCVKKETKMC